MLSSAVSTIIHLRPKNEGGSSSKHLPISNFVWLNELLCQRTCSPVCRLRDLSPLCVQAPIKQGKTQEIRLLSESQSRVQSVKPHGFDNLNRAQ